MTSLPTSSLKDLTMSLAPPATSLTYLDWLNRILAARDQLPNLLMKLDALYTAYLEAANAVRLVLGLPERMVVELSPTVEEMRIENEILLALPQSAVAPGGVIPTQWDGTRLRRLWSLVRMFLDLGPALAPTQGAPNANGS